MGKAITGLKPQAKRADRVNVYLDGEFGFGLRQALASSLRIGQELSEEQIEALQREDRRETAHRRAVQRIARRPRSEHELATELERRGLAPEDREAVIGRLREAGLADDLQFARAWIENRSAFRPRAVAALRAELRRKGISRPLIDRALEDFDETEAARRAAATGARKYQNLSPDLFRRRLSAYLSRRGFDDNTISPLVRQMAAEVESESEEST